MDNKTKQKKITLYIILEDLFIVSYKSKSKIIIKKPR